MAGFAKTIIIGIMLTGGCFLTAASAGGELYVYIDEQGAYHFTDKPTATKYIKARSFTRIRTSPLSVEK